MHKKVAPPSKICYIIYVRLRNFTTINKQKENIVSVEKIQRKKYLCITLLGDDETWTEDGMVVLIDTEEAKEWYNEEYEENILEFGWEELQE